MPLCVVIGHFIYIYFVEPFILELNEEKNFNAYIIFVLLFLQYCSMHAAIYIHIHTIYALKKLQYKTSFLWQILVTLKVNDAFKEKLTSGGVTFRRDALQRTKNIFAGGGAIILVVKEGIEYDEGSPVCNGIFHFKC